MADQSVAVPQPDIYEMIVGHARNAAQSAASVAASKTDAAQQTSQILQTAGLLQANKAADQAVVERTVGGGKLETERVMSRALQASGGYDRMLELISTSANLGRSIQDRTISDQITGRVAIWEDPIERIKHIVDWTGNRRAMREEEARKKIADTLLIQQSNNLSQAANIAKITTNTLTQASVEAQARINATESAMLSLQLQSQAIAQGLIGVQAAAEADDKVLALSTGLAAQLRARDAHELALAEESRRVAQFDWQKEEADFRRLERGLARQDRLDAAEEKKLAKGFSERSRSYINLARTASGLPEMSPEEFSDQMKLGDKKELELMYVRGQRMAETGDPILATSPGELIQRVLSGRINLDGLGNPEKTKHFKLLMQSATEALSLEMSKKASPLQDDKDGSKRLAFLDNHIRQQLSVDATRISNNSPFYIGDLGAFIGTKERPGIDTFQSYPTVKKVLGKAVQANTPLDNPDIVFGLTMAAVKSGELNMPQAAADLSNMYRRAAAIRRAEIGVGSIGVILPETSAGYNVVINGEIINVANYQAVLTAMNAVMVRERLKEVWNRAATNVPGASVGEAAEQGIRRIPNAVDWLLRNLNQSIQSPRRNPRASGKVTDE